MLYLSKDLGVLTIIFDLVFSLYRPGELTGGVVRSPMLLTRTNFFVPIFLNRDLELWTATTGLLIFWTEAFGCLRRGSFPDGLTRINFRVPIFSKILFFGWFVTATFALTEENCLDKKIKYRIFLKAIAQWIGLRLPSCSPGFKSQAYHLSFYNLKLCHVEKTKIN